MRIKGCLVLILLLLTTLFFFHEIQGEETKYESVNRHPSLINRPDCLKCHNSKSELQVDYTKDKRCIECHIAETDYALNQEKKNESNASIDDKEEEIIKQEMVYIPEGEAFIGNNGRRFGEGEGNPDEMPLHKISLKGYYIDKYEVTNAHYKRFVDATGHRIPKHWKDGKYPEKKSNHPVVYVSWYDADAFCRWSGKRLPTEEEWEKAARGTDDRSFPWGNQFDTRKANSPQYWLRHGKKGDTMPVGSFEEGKSPYGLYDMAGNVYEWTDSWYLPYPGNRMTSMHYGKKNKVMRGGSWYDCLSYGCGLSSPVYNRARFAPEIRNNGTGFRCARNEE
ncbi:MAG: formylglycine-generating enzyme family protein [Nitrospirota bacterium]